MNVVKKFTLFCVVLYVALSSPGVTATAASECYIELLKSMGKLSADFPSNLPPHDPLVCYRITELSTRIVKSSFHGEIRARIPDDADCLTEKFDSHKTIFDVIKIGIIDQRTTMDETEKQKQLEEARNELTEALEKIVVDCPTDKQKFINIFQVPLAIKNDTLEAHQTEYCLAKYTVDNKHLELGDAAVWNPHNINPESVDCDGIIAVERDNSERELRSVISAMPNVGKNLDCIMALYKTGNTFDSHAALKVLHFLDLPEETKASAAARPNSNFSNFITTSQQTCKSAN